MAPYSHIKQVQVQQQKQANQNLNANKQQQQQQQKQLQMANQQQQQGKKNQLKFNQMNNRFNTNESQGLLKDDLKPNKKKFKTKPSSSSSSNSNSSSSSKSSSSSTRSSSSDSSSSESDNSFIKLTNKNLKAKNKNLSKFNKNKRKLDSVDDKSAARYGMNTKITFNNNNNNKKQKRNGQNNNLISRKFIIDNSYNFTVARKSLKNIFELEKEHNEDLKEIENLKNMGICHGTSTDLEKEYLRLTGPPDSTMIRSLPILKKSFQFVLDKYSKTNDYRYICDQLKAIRQDLTVQVIKNEFTIQVYETHGRIAIKNKDRDEFNQCQSQLKSLYEMVNESSTRNNSAEFVGYRLIYNMLTKSFKDLNQVIKEIKSKYSDNKYLQHLLELNNAWYLNNYVKFFRLYEVCNEMSKYLIELFIERERKLALKIIIKSFRPTIKLEKVKELLDYDSLEACETELSSYKLCLQQVSLTDNSMFSNQTSTYETVLDCKSCTTQNL